MQPQWCELIKNGDCKMTTSLNLTANTAAAPAADTLDIAKRSDDLRARCTVWNNTAYRTANEQLYALLAEAYQLYSDLSASDTLRKEFRDHLVNNGVAFQRNTPLATRVIRFLFTAKNGRGAVWGKVLQLAKKANRTAAQLPAWIAEAGGIEEIAVNRQSKTSTQDSENIKFAEAYFGHAAAISAIGKLPDQLKPDTETDYKNYSLALVRSDNGTDGVVVWGTGNASAIAHVLELAGKELRKKEAVAAAEEDQRVAAQSAAEAIQEAANSFVAVEPASELDLVA